MDDWLLWPHIMGEEDLTETESEPSTAGSDVEPSELPMPPLIPQSSPAKSSGMHEVIHMLKVEYSDDLFCRKRKCPVNGQLQYTTPTT